MINISHYMSTETLSRKEIHMFEARTHKQCLSYYRTHRGAGMARGHSVQSLIDSGKLHTSAMPFIRIGNKREVLC